MGPLALLIGSGFFLNRDVDPFYEDQFFFFFNSKKTLGTMSCSHSQRSEYLGLLHIAFSFINT